MPGDYSRKLFNRKKHYSAVLEQQGRVQLDADWNEQIDLQQYRQNIENADVIGDTGVPKKNGGFKISINQKKTDLVISPGRIYAAGLLLEREPEGTVTYKNQPHFINPDQSMFGQAQSGSEKILSDGRYLVWLEGWQREINYIDDPQIQEPALGEADTTTRLQNIWQVRLRKIFSDGDVFCDSDLAEWKEITATPTGKLNVKVQQNEDSARPCMIPPKGGYTSLENQLYRIQILKGGNENTATFAWSRDNGSVETAITEVSGSKLTVADLGRDDILGFSGGQWVEIVEPEPSDNPPTLFEISSVKSGLHQIELKTSAGFYKNKSNLKLRRWYVKGENLSEGIPLSKGWANLENGIQIQFGDGTYRMGDYWLFPARVATADVEWPRDHNGENIAQLPTGLDRRFCKLAVIESFNNNVIVHDCRPLFPSLTEISAEDIKYSNKNCTDSKALNVQEALDELCHKRDGACTYHVSPKKGWEKVFDEIRENEDAQICFQVGEYPLSSEINLENKGHLKLTGSGMGTRIIVAGAESAITFSNCKSVLLRDLCASTTSFIKKPATQTKHLNGVLNFLNCGVVKCYDLLLQSGSATKKQVSCITVRNDPKTAGEVTIQNCDLLTGHLQQGILLVNTTKCFVQNNRIKTYEVFNTLKKESFLSDKVYRANFRNILVSQAGIQKPVAVTGMSKVTVKYGGQEATFQTSNLLKNDWQRLIDSNPAKNIYSSADLINHVKYLAEKVVLDKNLASNISSFRTVRKSILTQTQSIASGGIIVSGTIAENVSILNNQIEDTLVGIHIGVSHQSERNVHDKAGIIHISGNTVEIVMPGDAGKRERHGIFVGNFKSLCIENNSIRLQRLTVGDFAIDGIKLWGMFGEKLMVNNNTISSKEGTKNNSFTNGIVVHPLVAKTGLQQWMVIYNLAIVRTRSFVISNGVVASFNTPG